MNLAEEIVEATMALNPEIVTVGAMVIVMETIQADGNLHLDFIKPEDQPSQDTTSLLERLVEYMRGDS